MQIDPFRYEIFQRVTLFWVKFASVCFMWCLWRRRKRDSSSILRVTNPGRPEYQIQQRKLHKLLVYSCFLLWRGPLYFNQTSQRLSSITHRLLHISVWGGVKPFLGLSPNKGGGVSVLIFLILS